MRPHTHFPFSEQRYAPPGLISLFMRRNFCVKCMIFKLHLSNMASDSKEQIEECARISAEAERERTLVTLSKKQAADEVNKFRKLSNFGWILYLLAGIGLIAGICVYAFEISPVYSWLLSFLPIKLQSVEVFMAVWTFISAGAALIFGALNKLVNFLGSENRESTLYERFYKQNKSMIN